MTPRYKDESIRLAKEMAKSDNSDDILMAKAILTALGAMKSGRVVQQAFADALTAFAAGAIEKLRGRNHV